MKARISIALAALAWPAAAPAQTSELHRCDEAYVGLQDVAVGADLSGVRTFYQGNVTLFALDTVEPACCPAGVAIVMPAEPRGNEPVGFTCWAIKGLAAVDLRAARSSYDPRRGLTLTIPTRGYDPDTGATIPAEAQDRRRARDDRRSEPALTNRFPLPAREGSLAA
jgi:hypothetical protein